MNDKNNYHIDEYTNLNIKQYKYHTHNTTYNTVIKKNEFHILDNYKLKSKIIEYSNNDIIIINLYIPSIQCNKCVWILENINKINNKIIKSTVDLHNQHIRIFIKKKYKISNLIKFLTQLGYEPNINMTLLYPHPQNIQNNTIYKIAISFFCFGNVMLLSLPEYINNHQDIWLNNNIKFFRYISLLLCIPTIIICVKDYIYSSFISLKKKIINVKIPIAIGVSSLLIKSVYDIITNSGSGYLDSLSGFIFFISISQYIKNKTNNFIKFQANYTDLYPIYINIKFNNKEKQIPINQLKISDILLIKNNEIIPADSILISEIAILDNSFITGEYNTVYIKKGEKIFAGSKNKGQLINLKVIKKIEKSYLTTLWKYKNKNKNRKILFTHQFSSYFILSILTLSLITCIYWYFVNKNNVINSIVSILIIACPCALTLSPPFTLGYIIKKLSEKGILIKNIDVIENISKIDYIIFDKTGTITDLTSSAVVFKGKELTKNNKILISSLLRNSIHPLSQKIYNHIKTGIYKPITHYKEIIGEGVEGVIDNMLIKIGSANFVNININKKNTHVFVSINKKIKGCFIIYNKYVKNIKNIFHKLLNYHILILSGDNATEKSHLKNIINTNKIKFNANPIDKINIIKKLKTKHCVMMIGDGINDIGAIKESDIGICILNKHNHFIPDADVMLNNKNLKYLPDIFNYSKIGMIVIKINLIISIIYNIIGLSFAVTASLKPMISAILMPFSSITIILCSVGLTSITLKIYNYLKKESFL